VGPAIAASCGCRLPGVRKHRGVWARANLIERCRPGPTVHGRLKAEPMRSAVEWLTRYERFWNEKLDRLANFLEEEPWPTSQASRSSDASERRRAKSSAPGRTRKK